METIRNIAVVGGGIAGLSAAWLLSHRHRVTLFEANDYVGGHSNTVEVDTPDGCASVDTGFVVFNSHNYPNLVALFDWLNVASRETAMSFSVSAEQGRYEYAGTNLNTLFAQRSRLLDRRHLKLLADVIRFNRVSKLALARELHEGVELGEFLDNTGFDRDFQDRYLLPMSAAIWSCPPARMRAFPAHSFLSFFRNHGLLNLVDRPRWRTVSGGSQSYVEKMLRRLRNCVRLNEPVLSVCREPASVSVATDSGVERFDDVVFGCHADQALRLIANPDNAERELLGAFAYQHNRAILHSDVNLMPLNPRVWSAWNYLSRSANSNDSVFVTYWMNQLQKLQSRRSLFVTLNPVEPPAADHVIASFDYEHPVFDQGAIAAQPRLQSIQGADRLWFCGSYFGYGFHEDAYSSSLAMCARLGVHPPWESRTQPGIVTGGIQEATA